jgi:hypothetical protein
MKSVARNVYVYNTNFLTYTLSMGAVCFSETSVPDCQTVCYNQECHCHENITLHWDKRADSIH